MAEIKAGYKQTNASVIPEDWDLDKIKNVCQITTGDKNTQDRIDSGKYPFFVRSQQIERINTYSFDGEAVLTAGDGVGTGKIFHYINGKFDFHQRVYKMSHFSKRVDGFYFFKYFSNYFYARIMSMTAKSSVDSVRMEMIANMQIPLPKPKEQERIVTVLSDMDSLIESIEQLIAKKQDIKTAAMQQLLTGKKRLPGFEVLNGYKQTDIGVVPEDWDTLLMGDLAQIQRGASPRPINSPIWFDDKSSVGWLRISDVSKSIKYLKKTTQNLSEEGIANSRFVTKQNLVMSICATVGRPIITHKNLCIHDGFVVFNQMKAEKEYMYYVLSNIEKNWSKYGQTGSQMNLNTKLINNTRIPLPSFEEQKAIATILSDMDAEIDIIKQRLEKTHNLKTGMMQELLTGKTRLIKTNKT